MLADAMNQQLAPLEACKYTCDSSLKCFSLRNNRGQWERRKHTVIHQSSLVSSHRTSGDLWKSLGWTFATAPRHLSSAIPRSNRSSMGNPGEKWSSVERKVKAGNSHRFQI
ncbi:hypothetical protein AVEN_148638-1 [Araneus ventricosus]|uniref:Uncharacterized protein n=1 Tax=Araneus ventricosus TaxID=182803 RepID=A0A4Y2XA32_ARAVE|nr:hypothetical protein AVEN_95836-1 [Araneus ventricosus]GBO45822.1 hypothetical protein AVEN_148638-1 [Araneus ventricosus]